MVAMPATPPRELEIRVLASWAGRLEIDTALLDADGPVLVIDRRAFAADRRAIVRTARGVLVLAAPTDAAWAAADLATFVRDVEARPQAVRQLYYLPRAANASADVRVNSLGAADKPLLDELLSAAGSNEAEEADVSIDHLVAGGIVEDGRLLAIASMHEMGPDTVDIGVLVHPKARRRGLGAAVISDIASRASGKLVQYQCTPENEASMRVARACGFKLWGILQIASRPSPNSVPVAD